MAIKELVDQVRSQLPSEVLDKVGAALEQIKAEGLNLSDSLTAANNESKGRKIELREVKEKFQTVEIERDEWKKKYESFDNSDLMNERDVFKNKYESLINAQKSVFINSFEKIKSHPKFEKAKERFIIPEEKDNKIKWDALTIEQLEKNISTLNDLNSLDYFEDIKHPGTYPGKGVSTEVPVGFKEEIKAAKTHKEIEAVNRKYANMFNT